MVDSASPVHDGVGEGRRARPGARRRSGSAGLSRRSRARPRATLERAGRGDAEERALVGPPASAARTSSSSCAASSSGSVGVPSRRSVPATLPVSIVSPEQSRMSSAIWNAIPRLSPNVPSVAARAERAGSLEELPRLERAALEVGLDGRVGVVQLAPLHRFAAGEAEARIREHRDGVDVALGGELGEGPREEVVAGRARGIGAVLGPGRRPAAPDCGAVDQVVVDERRHVHELDRDTGRDRRCRVLAASRGMRAAAAAACRPRRARPRPRRRRCPGASRRPPRVALRPARGSRRGRAAAHSLERRQRRRPRVQRDDAAAEAAVTRRRRTRASRSARPAPPGRGSGARSPGGTCRPCRRGGSGRRAGSGRRTRACRRASAAPAAS